MRVPLEGGGRLVVAMTPDEATALGEALKSAVERCENRGVHVTSVLRDGPPWEEINAVADDLDADLIVLGTHGRRGLRRALLGSVAENVIRTTTRPVLTIHGVERHEAATKKEGDADREHPESHATA